MNILDRYLQAKPTQVQQSQNVMGVKRLPLYQGSGLNLGNGLAGLNGPGLTTNAYPILPLMQQSARQPLPHLRSLR